MYNKTKEEIEKVINESFFNEDLFVSQVGPNLFRIGMGNGNPPLYTNREGVLSFNKAVREAHEEYWKDKGNS